MKNSKLSMTLWIGGLVSGVFAGYYLYQNREKLGPQKDKMVKLLGDLQKTSEQIGKKLTNLSGEKLKTAMNSIREFAEDVTYEELEPLFGTAAKKTGTRIGVLLSVGVLMNNGRAKTQAIFDFIESCKIDENEILKSEAEKLA